LSYQYLSDAQYRRGATMQTHPVRTTDLFAADAGALVNGFARIASHLMVAPIEHIANACDVAGLLAARRAMQRAGSRLYEAAEREGHRLRRRGSLFGCLHYLSELT
jgi:hypothetical protein